MEWAAKTDGRQPMNPRTQRITGYFVLAVGLAILSLKAVDYLSRGFHVGSGLILMGLIVSGCGANLVAAPRKENLRRRKPKAQD
jgi:hypothetical protein